MALVKIELVEGIEAVLAAACIEGVFGPACLLHIDVDSSIFHANISKLFTNEGKRFVMPHLGESCIVSFAHEKDDETDYEEGHETAFHDILLSKFHWVERLGDSCSLGFDYSVEFC